MADSVDKTMKLNYEELAMRALKSNRRRKSGGENNKNQWFIGIAGAPGSGKSTLAEAVANIINEREEKEIAVVLPMDGYHISRDELQRMGASGKIIGDPLATTGDSTSFEDLLARRGAPWTFDASSLIRDFKAAKERGQASLPTYSRQLSDPIPNGVELKPTHEIALCEGNYLCAFDDSTWAPLAELWDDKWFVAASQDTILERLISRHLLTWSDEKSRMWGEGTEGARAKAEANDLKNALWIEMTSKHHTNLVIESR